MKMVVLNENISITNHASEVRLPDLKNNNEVTICQHGIIVNFFDGAVFILSSLVTGPSFMSMSALVLELCHISYIRNWSEIRKSKIHSSEFWPLSGDWGKLRIQNLAWMFLTKSYWMLQNFSAAAFTACELLRENQQGSKITTPPSRLL